MRVVIIGGGVIGLACAYELLKRGEEVAVLDQGAMGMAASWGNAGWIVPSLSGPVPAPGLTLSALRMLLKPDSPLYIKMRLDPGFARWMWEFRRKCNARDYERGLGAIAQLTRRTMELYDSWQAEGVCFEMHHAGLVFAYLTEAGLHHGLGDFAYLEEFGYARPAPLDGNALRQIVPMLSQEVIGGYVVEPERHVQPRSLTAGLVARLESQGAELRSHVRVTGLRRINGRVVAAETSSGSMEGDVFLLAAGAWSGALARSIGFCLPVESGKGYSITVSRPRAKPEVPVYLGEAKVGITPFDESLRLAGTMELSGISDDVDSRRVEAIRRSAARYLIEWPQGEGETVWGGMRPMTPDGLPVLGQAPGFENVYVATGHSMLGVTLAPATGTAMARLICGEDPEVDLLPFDPERFSKT